MCLQWPSPDLWSWFKLKNECIQDAFTLFLRRCKLLLSSSTMHSTPLRHGSGCSIVSIKCNTIKNTFSCILFLCNPEVRPWELQALQCWLPHIPSILGATALAYLLIPCRTCPWVFINTNVQITDNLKQWFAACGAHQNHTESKDSHGLVLLQT